MRMPVLSLLTMFVLVDVGSAAMAAAPTEPRALELAWHRCLREAYAHQPPGQSRAGDERNALDECKAQEDAFVASLMAAGPPDGGRSGSVWARTWAAFVEPLTAWIGGLRR
ncbi:hypothetical protein [Methylobacterium brachiatum]|uniref:hypothetical protein n=1 Tax=Methylobacterium brachiatum TaxID=269660 RepID=UPI000EFA5DE9|nr:hypothetical protein [Methylobacterium brachiatum]AYO84131.1 hypothetical protein EBB05_18920 [Methylobacterium brachiatum]